MATYVKISEKVEGPFTDSEIRDRIQRGVLTPASPAWKMGMPEWKTVADLVPLEKAAPPQPPAPTILQPNPSDSSLADDELMAEAQAAAATLPRPQADALDRLIALGDRFFAILGNRQGQIGRTNHTFFAHRVVTTAIQRIRLDLLKGASLTPKGEEFVGLAAAYLGMIAVLNWRRRGLAVSGAVQFDVAPNERTLWFFAERRRGTELEVYCHDFLADMHALLLKPPQAFPSMPGRFYIIQSLTLPPPEYLYQYGVHLMQSHVSRGNWPQGEKAGGLEQDFQASRELLVNDLHQDCGLPKDDAALRKLSWWVVFPPYGWDMNDGQDYNMMTLFDQISIKKVVPRDTGIDYLRALLRCQSLEIRNLAARCLIGFRAPPRHMTEATHYKQAIHSSDWELAAGSVAKYRAQVEGNPTPDQRAAIEGEVRGWLDQTPPTLSHRTAAENDPDYVALCKMPTDRVAEGIAALEALLAKYSNDWTLKVIHASQLMRGPDLARGEARLRELIQNPPNSCEAHSRLGTMLKGQGRVGEAMQVYEDEVRRWPWNYRAVDSCMWLLTDGMTQFQ